MHRWGGSTAVLKIINQTLRCSNPFTNIFRLGQKPTQRTIAFSLQIRLQFTFHEHYLNQSDYSLWEMEETSISNPFKSWKIILTDSKSIIFVSGEAFGWSYFICCNNLTNILTDEEQTYFSIVITNHKCRIGKLSFQRLAGR